MRSYETVRSRMESWCEDMRGRMRGPLPNRIRPRIPTLQFPKHQAVTEDGAENNRRSVRCLRALDVLLLDPRHQAAQPRAGFLDWMLFAVRQELLVILVAAFVFRDPPFRE